MNHILLWVIQRNNLNRVRINEVDCITFVKLSNVLEWRYKKTIFLQHVYCVVINLNVKILQAQIKKKQQQQKKRKQDLIGRTLVPSVQIIHCHDIAEILLKVALNTTANQPTNQILHCTCISFYYIISNHIILLTLVLNKSTFFEFISVLH